MIMSSRRGIQYSSTDAVDPGVPGAYRRKAQRTPRSEMNWAKENFNTLTFYFSNRLSLKQTGNYRRLPVGNGLFVLESNNAAEARSRLSRGRIRRRTGRVTEGGIRSAKRHDAHSLG